MKNMLGQFQRLGFDLIVRITGLMGKFILIFFIAKYLDEGDLGVYGLITSTIAIANCVIGMDFYTYSQRQLLHSGQADFYKKLYNQSLFFLLNYIILFFFWPYVLDFSGINGFMMLTFVITICEHFSQELYRLLIILKRTDYANIQLFLRVGGWCYLVSGLLMYEYGSLDFILKFWAIFSFLSAVLGLFFIVKIVPFSRASLVIDWRWSVKGIKFSLFIFMGALFSRAVFYLDKVVAQYLVDMRELSAYIFYMGIANAVQAILEVTVIAREYPRLISVCKEAELQEINLTIKNFRNKLIKHNIVIAILAILGGFLATLVLNKSSYLSNFYILPLLCLFYFFINLVTPYHYVIYSFYKDKIIFLCNMFGFFLFAILSFLLVTSFKSLGITVLITILLCYSLFMLAMNVNQSRKILARMFVR